MLTSQQRTVTSKRQCPICHGEKSYGLFDLHFALLNDCPLPAKMPVAACCQCGFVFYDTEASENDFNDFYANHYTIHAYQSGSGDYQKNIGYLEDIAKFLLESGIDKNAAIADMGCGQGQLIRYFAQQGFIDLLGVELCAQYVNQLNDDGIPAKIGSVNDIFSTDQKKDVLIYKHIFEHLYDIASAVQTAADNLNPHGYLLVAVPDARHYNEFSPYSFLHYLTLEHINHFDLHHIQYLFRNFGFSMVNYTSQMLNIAEDYPVPTLTCLFQKSNDQDERDLTANFDLSDEMLDCFMKSQDLNTPELIELTNSQGRIYVWGLSYRTSMHLAMSELRHFRIEAYVDIDPQKQGKRINGQKVLSPDILDQCTPEDTIVIGVGPSSKKMESLIREKGFRGRVIRLT